MCEPDCTHCPPSFALLADIDVCTNTTDDVPPPPAKRAKVGPKVFVHVSQDVPKWAEGMEVRRYNTQKDPALKRKQVGDWRVRKDGFKATLRVGNDGQICVKTPIAPRQHKVMGKVGRRSIASSMVEGPGVKNPIAPRPPCLMAKGGRRSFV